VATEAAKGSRGSDPRLLGLTMGPLLDSRWGATPCIEDRPGPRVRPQLHNTIAQQDRQLILCLGSGTVAASRLTCRSVANIVKEYAGRAGFDAAIYSAHSLRSGFLTSAAATGASIFKMMDQFGHKSIDTLRGYVRDAELFKDHAGAGLL
jgi:integrase